MFGMANFHTTLIISAIHRYDRRSISIVLNSSKHHQVRCTVMHFALKVSKLTVVDKYYAKNTSDCCTLSWYIQYRTEVSKPLGNIH